METSYSYDFKLKSHPDKLLVAHLQEVTNYGFDLLADKAIYPENQANYAEWKNILKDIFYIMGAYHDITKAITYFQHYLLTPNHEVIGPKSHSLLSALLVKEISKKYLQQADLKDFEKELLALFAFTGVKRHHGNLDNLCNEVYIAEKSEELQKQIKVFNEQETQEIINHFNKYLSINYDLQDFKKYIESKLYEKDMPDFYEDNYEDIGEKLPIYQKIEYFYIHQLLFGTLLLSDKTDVIMKEDKNYEKPIISLKLLADFREKKHFDIPKNEIDKVKNKAFKTAIDNLDIVFSKEKHIYSLTFPTGLGKTITSFGVALAIKQKLNLPSQRIIINIPFTSIIDQNFDVYQGILNSEDSRILLKHHHLAEPVYKINDDELDGNKSQFLIETWQSEVVVTTFVQFLNSIFSNNKSFLMKIPNIVNAIIILDEIQTVPYKYWQLIKSAFETLGKLYNCYFILMSATQPLIFVPDEEITEIVPNYKDFFGYFNRTILFNKTQKKITLTEFTTEIHHYLTENPQKDILVILNTKKHSKECFENIVKLLENEQDEQKNNNEIYYLSTLITPFERKVIIKKIKEKSSKRKIIIATQLIEAGVDISVDTVFRVLAPIDAIIQAVGRANRYDEKPHQGEIYLYEIEEMKFATSIIYGADLIQKTKNVLKNIDKIEEKNYLQLIENYFLEVRKQSDNLAPTHLKAMTELRFKDLGEFSFIEEQDTESVFVQLNETAKNIWEKYVAISKDQNITKYDKKHEFAKIKSVFYDYVINVPKNKVGIDFDSEKQFNFYVSPLHQPSQYYIYDVNDFTKNTGYQDKKALIQL